MASHSEASRSIMKVLAARLAIRTHPTWSAGHPSTDFGKNTKNA
jgi:hypothetical protein